jgi:CheY-like chemotaxis protein
VRRHVEEIKKAGERSAALTRQLLAFSRRQMLEVQVLDINQIINDSIVMLQRVIGDDIEIVADLDPNLGKIKGDAGQLSQILMNLVVNSRDAMPQGGRITIETGNVTVEEKFLVDHAGARTGDCARLKISDTGTGIDEETRKFIFEPFFTTKDVGQGTGLGLSTVYGIVKQLDGYVSLESGPDEPAVFEIYFPVVPENKTRQSSEPKTEDTSGGTETILLVEDEPLVRSLCREILESDGYDVKVAENGVAAMELYRDLQGKIDLLMTDVVMSQMSGRELAEKLVAEQPSLKVLFTSGYTDNFALTHGEVAPEMNFIQKPFTSAQVARKIREVLDGRIA